jgi:dolichyl-phosphate-mannose--protein O-mannosyl transferase
VTSGPRRWTSADTVTVTLVTAAAAVLRSVHLTRPRTIVFDEFFYAREACFLVHRSQQICGIGEDAISPHPPLGKWLISLGIRMFGYHPLGWRIAALIAGILTVALLYVLGRRLLGTAIGAGMTAGLLAIDPLHFVQSRIAMLDVFVTLFVVASFLFLVIDRDRAEETGRGTDERRTVLDRRWLLAAGLAAGMAAATKWVGFLALGGVAGIAALWAATRVGAGGLFAKIRGVARREGPTLVVSMILVPSIVYVASFIGRIEGSVSSWPWTRGSWVRNLLGVQREMLRFHLAIQDVSPFTSPAWSWPLIRRPVVYFHDVSGGSYREILALGSPVVWWASLIALAILVIGIRRRRRQTEAAVVAIGGFAVLYLPWLASTGRSFTFLFYLLPAVPFMCLALAIVATPWIRSLRGRLAVTAFAALAITCFVFFYPVLTAAPLSRQAFEARRWFDDCRAPPGSLASDGWCWR